MGIRIEKCDLCKDEIRGSAFCINGGVYCSQVCSSHALYPTQALFLASKHEL